MADRIADLPIFRTRDGGSSNTVNIRDLHYRIDVDVDERRRMEPKIRPLRLGDLRGDRHAWRQVAIHPGGF